MEKACFFLSALVLLALPGCDHPPEFDCEDEACAATFEAEIREADPIIDPRTEPLQLLAIDGTQLTFEVYQPLGCRAPEVEINLWGIGRSAPPTALTFLDVFVVGCHLEGPVAEGHLATVVIDVTDALPVGTCVGRAVVGVPGFDEPIPMNFDEVVCGDQLRHLRQGPHPGLGTDRELRF